MGLVLQVVHRQAGTPEQEVRPDLSATALVIGRSADSGLVLDDPERTISGHHARIDSRSGGIWLTDTSRNGTCLNGEFMQPNQGVLLHDGDRFSVGPYEIHVCFGTPVAPAPAQPNGFTPQVGDPGFAPAGASLDVLDLVGAPGGSGADFVPAPPPLDPGWPAAPPPPADPLRQDFAGVASAPGRQPPVDYDPLASPAPRAPEPAPAPRPAPAAARSAPPPAPPVGGKAQAWSAAPPPDYDPLSDAAMAPAPADVPPVPPTAPQAAPPEPDPEPVSADPAADAPASEEANDEAETRPVPDPEEWAEILSAATPRRPMPGRARAPVPPQTGTQARAADSDLAAFLGGLGLGSATDPEHPEVFLHQCGELLRALVAGLVQTMMARSQFKSELRLGVTTIRAAENNPFKFSVDVNECLQRHLLHPTEGYQPLVPAAREAFEDIQAHEMAMTAGLQAALRALFARFAPERLEQRLGSQSRLDRLVPMSRKAKYWDLFTETYEQVAADAAEDFMQLFDDAFARAYQEQIARLRAARGMGRE